MLLHAQYHVLLANEPERERGWGRKVGEGGGPGGGGEDVGGREREEIQRTERLGRDRGKGKS